MGSNLDGFIDELKQAVVNYKTLEIVTAVGPLQWDPATKSYVPVAAANTSVMRTTIDLIQGDTVTQIDPAFVTGGLVGLREYHEKAVAGGHDVAVKTFEAVKALFDLAIHFNKPH